MYRNTLGKTIQTLGLIRANPPAKWTGGGPRTKIPKATIIVAPVSVMNNWSGHIHKYVNVTTYVARDGTEKTRKKQVLRSAIFHGSKRSDILDKLERNQMDVVIISYDTLVSEMKKLEKRQKEEEEEEAKRQLLAKSAQEEKKEEGGNSDDDDDDSGSVKSGDHSMAEEGRTGRPLRPRRAAAPLAATSTSNADDDMDEDTETDDDGSKFSGDGTDSVDDESLDEDESMFGSSDEESAYSDDDDLSCIDDDDDNDFTIFDVQFHRIVLDEGMHNYDSDGRCDIPIRLVFSRPSVSFRS